MQSPGLKPRTKQSQLWIGVSSAPCPPTPPQDIPTTKTDAKPSDTDSYPFVVVTTLSNCSQIKGGATTIRHGKTVKPSKSEAQREVAPSSFRAGTSCTKPYEPPIAPSESPAQPPFVPSITLACSPPCVRSRILMSCIVSIPNIALSSAEAFGGSVGGCSEG